MTENVTLEIIWILYDIIFGSEKRQHPRELSTQRKVKDGIIIFFGKMLSSSFTLTWVTKGRFRLICQACYPNIPQMVNPKGSIV
jgi:hypothetical protein